MRSRSLVLAMVGAVGSLLVACATGRPAPGDPTAASAAPDETNSRMTASAWQAPPRCDVETRPGSSRGGQWAGLVVDVRDFESGGPIYGVQLTGAGTGSINANVPIKAGPSGPDGRLELGQLAPGNYELWIRRIGYAARTHRVKLAAGQVDTLVVHLPPYEVPFRSPCEPPRRRPAWTGWCAPPSADRDYLVAWARDFVRRGDLEAFELPSISAEQVALVTDEALCERAAAAYGAYVRNPVDSLPAPRRSVVVVRLGPVYYVDDPFEPLWFGEWTGRPIFDAEFRHLVTIVG